MVTNVRLFKIIGTSMHRVAQERFADDHYESQLEDWIFRNPELLGDDLMMLGRQVKTDAAKKIDLLALDREGNAVIIEVKRGDASRELVGQILEYVAAVEGWTERDLEKRTGRAARSLEKEFRTRFSCDPPADFNSSRPTAVVVVERTDDTVLKTLRHNRIKVLSFAYHKNADEEYVLVNDLGAREASGSETEKRQVRKALSSTRSIRRNAQPKEEHPWTQRVKEWLAIQEPKLTFVTGRQLFVGALQGVGKPFDRRAQLGIATALRDLGWVKHLQWIGANRRVVRGYAPRPIANDDPIADLL